MKRKRDVFTIKKETEKKAKVVESRLQKIRTMMDTLQEEMEAMDQHLEKQEQVIQAIQAGGRPPALDDTGHTPGAGPTLGLSRVDGRDHLDILSEWAHRRALADRISASELIQQKKDETK